MILQSRKNITQRLRPIMTTPSLRRRRLIRNLAILLVITLRMMNKVLSVTLRLQKRRRMNTRIITMTYTMINDITRKRQRIIITLLLCLRTRLGLLRKAVTLLIHNSDREGNNGAIISGRRTHNMRYTTNVRRTRLMRSHERLKNISNTTRNNNIRHRHVCRFTFTLPYRHMTRRTHDVKVRDDCQGL